MTTLIATLLSIVVVITLSMAYPLFKILRFDTVSIIESQE